MSRVMLRALFPMLFVALAGCATAPGADTPVSDPLEPVNRGVLSFNETVDDYVMAPVARGYKAVMPLPARVGVSNFFSNVEDLWTGVNNLLQGKPADAASDVGRVLLNSTVGVLGFFDVASEFGLDKHKEDFGQTLGKWGMASGPYIELPFLGPSTLRDGTALFLDFKADPIIYATNSQARRNQLFILRAIDTRQQLLGLETTMDQAATDKYIFRRNFYLRKREADVNDGRRAPREDDFDE